MRINIITQKLRITMRSWRDGVWKRLCPKNTKPKSESSEVELRRAVEINSCLETWCARAVVAALVFEAIVLWWYADPKKWHETAALILSDVLLAVAIAWEIVFGRRANNALSDLQTISDQKVAESNERAAEANRKAEEANLALAMYWTPRQLGDDAINRIADKLRPYAGIKYVGGVNFSHLEFITLLGYIEEALEDAGWIEVDCPKPRRIERKGKPSIWDGAPVIRVKIELHTETRSPAIDLLANAGIALRDALNAEPKGLEARFSVTWEEPSPGEIATMYVMIGPKI
jgi:hypothetical protein